MWVLLKPNCTIKAGVTETNWPSGQTGMHAEGVRSWAEISESAISDIQSNARKSREIRTEEGSVLDVQSNLKVPGANQRTRLCGVSGQQPDERELMSGYEVRKKRWKLQLPFKEVLLQRRTQVKYCWSCMRDHSVRDQDWEGSSSRSSCFISGYSCIRGSIAHVEKEIMLLLVKIMAHIILHRSFYCCYSICI